MPILIEQLAKRSAFRTDLQYLRAFSIFAVVVYHANEDFFKIGYLGVDFFFCISGFVLAPKLLSITDHHEMRLIIRSFRLFVKDRIYRLYPPMLFCIVVSIPLIALTLPTGKYLEKALSQAEFALFSAGNLSASSLVGDYFDPAPNPFLHLWSLGAEWQLYILFAFSACLLAFYKLDNPRRLFLFFISLFSFFSVLVFLLSPSGGTFNYYNPFLRLWEFGLGIIAYSISQKFSKFNSRIFMYLMLSALLLLIVIPLKDSLNHAETVLLLLLFLPFVVFSDSGFRGNGVVLWVASRSYSIYLYHWVFFAIVKHSKLGFFESQSSKALLTFAALILTLLFSEITFRLFEKPSSPSMVSRRSRLLVLLVTSLAIIAPLDVANSKSFWGFNNLNAQPRFAGDVDPNCDRTMVIDRPCFYGGYKNSSTLNLIGDSHAAALSSAIVDVGTLLKLNVRIWSYKGCKYVDPLVLSRSDAALYSNSSDPCFRRDEAFRKYLALHPEDIVLGAWRSQDCEYNIFLGLCGTSFVDLQIDSFQRFSLAGHKVVIVTSVPEFRDLKFFAPRALFQPEYRATHFEVKHNMVAQSFLDEKYLDAHSSGLNLVSSEKILCNTSSCMRKKGSRWLYRDTNHLSIDGANLFIPRIIQALQSH